MTSIGSLFKLTDLIPPPDYPIGGNGDWKRFVSANGFWPPEDYRMMIREYGVGTFGGWISLLDPFGHSKPFVGVVQDECQAMREARNKAPTAYPNWPLWPEPGGLMPWAKTNNGDHVCWRTDGKPDGWTTRYWGAGTSVEFDMSTVDFLVGLAQRSLSGGTFSLGVQHFLPAGSNGA